MRCIEGRHGLNGIPCFRTGSRLGMTESVGLAGADSRLGFLASARAYASE
jgi:hypothetical protein